MSENGLAAEQPPVLDGEGGDLFSKFDPVIAMRRGSVPEVLSQGISGFMVRDEDEAVAAVHAAASVHVAPFGAEGAADAAVRFAAPEKRAGDLLEGLADEGLPAGELAALVAPDVGRAVAFHPAFLSSRERLT